MQDYRTKKHRLERGFYVGTQTVAYTLCVCEHRKLFADAEVVERFLAALKLYADGEACLVPIYCFMPDHLHLMIRGRTDGSDMARVVAQFKQRTGRWLRLNRPGFRWQPSYYDHVVRMSEDWQNQALYILNNPVRAKLIEDPYEYPFTGSIGFDLAEMFFDMNI